MTIFRIYDFRKSRLYCYVMVLSLLMGACTRREDGAMPSEGFPMERIFKDTELPRVPVMSMQHFSERDADYNPGWVVKMCLSNQTAFVLKEELGKKRSYPLEIRGALSAQMPWWTPAKTAVSFQYITSYNAPVLVILSPVGEQVDVFIEWASP